MEGDKTKESLYFPQGLKENREYYDGFGKKELQITGVGTAIGSCIDVIIYLFNNNVLLCVFIFLAIPATIVMCVVKDTSNISVVDQIKFMIRFSRSQKRFRYIYQDEWR